MQIIASEFIGLNVVSVQSAEVLGVINGFVLKPEDLKIIVFSLQTFSSREKHYLLPRDIRHFNNQKVLIDSLQNISEFSDLVRYQHDITNDYALIHKPVETVGGKKLGRVVDYMFDPAHYYITKLKVRPRLLSGIFVSSLLIDRSSIVETKQNVIIVKDNFAMIKKTATVPLPQNS